MRFDFKAVMATGISLWLAAAGVPDGLHASEPRERWFGERFFGASTSSPEQNSMDLMAGMENCPHHHSGGSAPAKPHGEKPVHGGNMPCCPVEVTVASEAGHRQTGNCAPARFRFAYQR